MLPAARGPGCRLKYVGYTSDYPATHDAKNGLAYFAVVAQGPWSLPANNIEYDIVIYPEGDPNAVLVLYTTRLGTEDVFVSNLVDVITGETVDTQLINGRFGDVDTALYDSDAMLIPVSLAALADYGVTAKQPRVSYGVEGYSAGSNSSIDEVGFDSEGGPTLSANLYAPGVTVTDRAGHGPLVDDQPGTQLVVRRNLASYRVDKAQGLLMLHLHDTTGNKAQIVQLQATPAVALSVSPTKPARGQKATVTIKVTDPDQGSPTGAVSLVDATTNKVLAKGTLSKGSAKVSWTPTSVGKIKIKATYAGATVYTGATSPVSTVTVAKSAAKTTLVLSPKTGSTKKTTTATIKVATVAGTAPTGKVILRRTSGGSKVIGTATLNKGKATIRFRPTTKGKISYRAEYAGDSRYASATSPTLKYTVT